jgi:hypothetical protein
MYQRKPCFRCGRPKPPGRGVKVCGHCRPVDLVWDRLKLGPGGCWLWTGSCDRAGYGRYSAEYLVHRMVYEFLIADIPPDLDLDHLCFITRCVNPWHLEPVTRGENSRRLHARLTHCKHGHELTPENTRLAVEGPHTHRRCRKCTAAMQRRYRDRKAAVG